uniref:Inositol polyphosphate-related phosphatase domain-containing protein n=2 Tax=Rhodosorus marinus TaxID=101924 RepID=A0A7S2ZM21_9RHOD|mmetsp:Transcript_23059/g.92269  ORF Transcript_23059/g.92269 Transcript_23059/m.92269 type:complete len:691 (+) Transcript_23059:348-2420(+)
MVLRVFCGTWNVNGKKPSVRLEPWLFPDGMDAQPPDIFIIGIQEAQALTAMTAVVTDPAKGKAWSEAIRKLLKPDYYMVCFRQLVGIVLLICAHRDVQVDDLLEADAGTGFLNVAGNKGGVAARFAVKGISISCVSSHLAAHEENISKRNQNFQDILKRATFAEPMFVEDLGNPARDIHILDHDVVFWVGDMNYRINLPVREVMQLIEQRDWSSLARYDQLKTEMNASRVAPGFEEGSLNFAPTYKHNSDTNSYRMDEEGGIKRTPSWTDRILWRSRLGVRLLAYRRHEVYSSDHRPVSALFDIPTEAVDRGILDDRTPLRSVARNRSLRDDLGDWVHGQRAFDDLSLLSNEHSTEYNTINFTSQTLVLPMLSYGKRVQANLVGTHTSRNATVVSIDPKTIPSWCTVYINGRIPPTTIIPAQPIDMVVTAMVSKKDGAAEKLTLQGEPLFADFVLIVEGTKSGPVRVRGTYEKSCFGISLENLLWYWGPLRHKAVPSSVPQVLPKEVWLLGNSLVGSAQPFPLNTSGREDFSGVRDQIDRGEEVHPGDHVAAAMCLLAFLRELPEPALSRGDAESFSEEEAKIGSLKAAATVLNAMPSSKRNLVVYVSGLLDYLPKGNDHPAVLSALAAALLQDFKDAALVLKSTSLLTATPLTMLFPSMVRLRRERLSRTPSSSLENMGRSSSRPRRPS